MQAASARATYLSSYYHHQIFFEIQLLFLYDANVLGKSMLKIAFSIQ